METKQSKKPVWKTLSFWILMIFVALPFAYGVISVAYDEMTLTPEQKDSIAKAELAYEDSIKAVEDSIEANRPKVYNMPSDGSVWQVKEYLKQNLNDASSYEPVSWTDVVLTQDNCYVVEHSYRAKNGFGALMLY